MKKIFCPIFILIVLVITSCDPLARFPDPAPMDITGLNTPLVFETPLYASDSSRIINAKGFGQEPGGGYMCFYDWEHDRLQAWYRSDKMGSGWGESYAIYDATNKTYLFPKVWSGLGIIDASTGKKNFETIPIPIARNNPYPNKGGAPQRIANRSITPDGRIVVLHSYALQEGSLLSVYNVRTREAVNDNVILVPGTLQQFLGYSSDNLNLFLSSLTFDQNQIGWEKLYTLSMEDYQLREVYSSPGKMGIASMVQIGNKLILAENSDIERDPEDDTKWVFRNRDSLGLVILDTGTGAATRVSIKERLPSCTENDYIKKIVMYEGELYILFNRVKDILNTQGEEYYFAKANIDTFTMTELAEGRFSNFENFSEYIQRDSNLISKGTISNSTFDFVRINLEDMSVTRSVQSVY